MQICLSVGVISSLSSNRENIFAVQTINLLARRSPNNTYIIISNRAELAQYIAEKNISFICVGTNSKNPLIWKWWYDVNIPTLLKKYKAEVLISCDGIVSLRTKTVQCLLASRFSHIRASNFFSRAQFLFLKKYSPAFLKKAKSVFCYSKQISETLESIIKYESGKIKLVPVAVAKYEKQLNTEEKKQIKKTVSEGFEFFLYVGNMHQDKNLFNLLKAFSLFKKMQRSNIKLILAITDGKTDKVFFEKINSYKFKEDVIILQSNSQIELVNYTSAAYAFIFPSAFESSGFPVLDALQLNTPVLTSAGTAMQELAGDAALYFNPADYSDIADQMMRIYKDENLRRQLVESGAVVASGYTLEKSAGIFEQMIADAIA